VVVTIDGPAAAGKSTTAKLVAAALGARHIDSGSLYRAVTAARSRNGGDATLWTEDDVLSAAALVTLQPTASGFAPVIGGREADNEIRSGAVTASVPRVSQMPGVRAWVKEQVRRAAQGLDVVVDGRDMGTAVFPQADVKVYLVADSWERARRRLRQRGEDDPSDDAVAGEMTRLIERDAKDAGQSVQAGDAVVIDTTGLTQDEQVAHIVALVRARTRGGA